MFFFFLKVLENAGFSKVQADDRTDLFVEALQSEVEILEGMKDEYIKVSWRFIICQSLLTLQTLTF